MLFLVLILLLLMFLCGIAVSPWFLIVVLLVILLMGSNYVGPGPRRRWW